MSRIVFASIVLTALLPLGCGRKPDIADIPPFEKPASLDKASNEDRRTLAADNTRFAIDLFRKLPAGDTAVSPFAVSSALAMSLAGAKGETADEMKRALCLSQPDAKLHPAFGALLWELYGQGQPRGYVLRLTNGFWADKRMTLEPPFAATLRDSYSAAGQSVDFRDRDKASELINAWAQKATAERISQIITPEQLAEETKLILASAVAFQGKWANEFDPKLTRPQDFHVSPTRTVKVPMMRQRKEESYRYYPATRDPVYVLRLPFTKREMEFVVLLPDEKSDIDQLTKLLSVEKLDEWLNAPEYKVEVIMPRFTLPWRGSLIEPLKELGMKRAFTPQADFSGVTTTFPLHIDRVNHTAIVTVDEAGTTAAAVVDVGKKDKGKVEDGRATFRADRPFLFLIRHPATKTILFIGRVVDPTD